MNRPKNATFQVFPGTADRAIRVTENRTTRELFMNTEMLVRCMAAALFAVVLYALVARRKRNAA
jgi:hypothetical protein